ncbi:endonuclease domain-containing 1 protein-like [Polypterus senegalus]|uniref:endonuclease domain-containing 1 protein-like n=1 Tax=Polypterus senegalus TaxID=55291 RepID=UPI0019652F21|nr:endonuclease domain-containing 1 protein-like [Polypterus senegalus]
MQLLTLEVLMCLATWGSSEVMKDQFTCKQFFHKGKEPSGLIPHNAARICQTYMNKVHFATMYDKTNRIPVFSAYKYNRNDENVERVDYYEPQLVDRSGNKNMDDMPNNISEKLKESQAVTEDYKEENMKISSKQYNRGHLSPIMHHTDTDSKKATCTLTNIVPQLQELNGGQWNEYETRKMQNFTNGCHTTYVIVGAIPGQKYTSIKNKKRVNVPSHIWTAACCVNEKGNPVKFLGYIAGNDKNEVTNISLNDLQNLLKTASGRGVTLFYKGC